MKILIGFIFLLSVANSFNLNSPRDICRRDYLNKISKVSLVSIILGKCKESHADEIDNKIEDYQNFMPNEPILLTSIDNDIYFYSSINQQSAFELEKKLLQWIR